MRCAAARFPAHIRDTQGGRQRSRALSVGGGGWLWDAAQRRCAATWSAPAWSAARAGGACGRTPDAVVPALRLGRRSGGGRFSRGGLRGRLRAGAPLRRRRRGVRSLRFRLAPANALGGGAWPIVTASSLVFLGAAFPATGKKAWAGRALLGGGVLVGAWCYVSGVYPRGPATAAAFVRGAVGVWPYLFMLAPAAFMACAVAGGAVPALGRRDGAVILILSAAFLAFGLCWGPPSTNAFDYLARFTPAGGLWAVILAAGAARRERAAKVIGAFVLIMFSSAVFLLGAVAAGVIKFDLALTSHPELFLGKF